MAMPSFGHKETFKDGAIAISGEETVMGSQGRIIAAVIALLALEFLCRLLLRLRLRLRATSLA
jgi:hypothetical protein